MYVQHGLQELWIKAGVEDTTRYIPFHTLFQRQGPSLCNVLPAVHSLTGTDITSKVGTKKAALKAEPEKFLKQFAKSPTLSEATINKTELYTIKVLKPQSEARNFTEFRAEIFHHSKSSSLHNLHPTSDGMLPHIKRSLYNAYHMIHCIDIQFETGNALLLKLEENGF